jgi:hypothetical protein
VFFAGARCGRYSGPVDRARYDAIVATFVGVLALVVSAYTAYVQRQQVRAQVYPILSFSTGYSDEDVHINLANKGSGPALIRSVFIGHEGRALHNWLELVQSVTKQHQTMNLSYSTFGHSVLSPGEDAHVFSVTCPKKEGVAVEHPKTMPVEIPAAATASPTMDPLPHDETCANLVRAIRKLSVSICYCSTLTDCWTLEDGPDRDQVTTEAGRCPAHSDRSFN